MEIKAKINKPYSENERLEFIVEYNHKLGYLIKETEYELQAWGYTEEEIQEQKREELNKLSLTAADVERAIYKVKGIDFEDILELIKDNKEIDLKALKIELKANHFFRGNPYVNAIGAILGFKQEQLDEFFKTNDYTKLMNEDE